MGLIGYHNNTGAAELPPPAGLFDYVFAGNGVYVHAKREHLEVNFPVMPGQIRGLADAKFQFDFGLPKVPVSLSTSMLVESAHYADQLLETLFHFMWSPVFPWNNGWEKIVPEQERSYSHCKPLNTDGADSTYQKAILEIHSHHGMPPNFSPQDDADETGFRLYGVIGFLGLNVRPVIRMRVGVYGQFLEVPASWVIELPEGLGECFSEY